MNLRAGVYYVPERTVVVRAAAARIMKRMLALSSDKDKAKEYWTRSLQNLKNLGGAFRKGGNLTSEHQRKAGKARNVWAKIGRTQLPGRCATKLPRTVIVSVPKLVQEAGGVFVEKVFAGHGALSAAIAKLHKVHVVQIEAFPEGIYDSHADLNRPEINARVNASCMFRESQGCSLWHSMHYLVCSLDYEWGHSQGVHASRKRLLSPRE